jgi:phosphohistidine phosphatase
VKKSTDSAPTRRLYLLRHAKSSWDDPTLADHDRPLAPRGQKATTLLVEYLRGKQIAPALVLCSPARRVVETYLGIEQAFGEDVSVQAERGLYGASADALLERLHEVPESVPSAMLIGHNPAIQELATALAHGSKKLEKLERKYPTGALATFTFEGDWCALNPKCVHRVNFVRPKDLR